MFEYWEEGQSPFCIEMDVIWEILDMNPIQRKDSNFVREESDEILNWNNLDKIQIKHYSTPKRPLERSK